MDRRGIDGDPEGATEVGGRMLVVRIAAVGNRGDDRGITVAERGRTVGPGKSPQAGFFQQSSDVLPGHEAPRSTPVASYFQIAPRGIAMVSAPRATRGAISAPVTASANDPRRKSHAPRHSMDIAFDRTFMTAPAAGV